MEQKPFEAKLQQIENKLNVILDTVEQSELRRKRLLKRWVLLFPFVTIAVPIAVGIIYYLLLKSVTR